MGLNVRLGVLGIEYLCAEAKHGLDNVRYQGHGVPREALQIVVAGHAVMLLSSKALTPIPSLFGSCQA